MIRTVVCGVKDAKKLRITCCCSAEKARNHDKT